MSRLEGAGVLSQPANVFAMVRRVRQRRFIFAHHLLALH